MVVDVGRLRQAEFDITTWKLNRLRVLQTKIPLTEYIILNGHIFTINKH